MRDRIKEEHYFNALIQKEEQNIIMFEEILEKTVAKSGENDRGARNGYSILINSYQKKINLMYSCGKELEEIEKCCKKLLFYYSKMWDRKYGYIELIKVLSLAVLFEVERNEIAELERKLVSEKFDDYLVNILLRRIDSEWRKAGESFEFEGIYDYLKVIVEKNKEERCQALKGYLEKKWYEIHKECAWYDSHKSKRNVYYGYWSFESGAIAKILNIEDSSLKNVSYYPYDLVHYKDNKY